MTLSRRCAHILGAAVLVVATASPGVALSSGAGPAPARGAAGVTSEGTVTLAVTGYAENGTPASVISASAPGLRTLGADGVNITANGRNVGAPDAGTKQLLATAHRSGLRAELLVGNYSEDLGDFDQAAAHRLLTGAANRRRVERRLVTFAAQGWDGIHLDFESLTGDDRKGLTAFTTELRKALPRKVSLSMAVMAGSDRAEYRSLGYDLAGLAPALNRVVLMAYDQHGPTWSGPGPVGGLPWVRRTLKALLAQVPAAKVDLGVAGYGYTWPATGTGRQVSDAEARALARNGRPVWDAVQGEWHATLGGDELWWSDACSLQARRRLAAGLGLHGLAVWSLGLSDPVRP